MTMEILKTFLGWCLVINYGVLIFWAIVLMTGDWATRLHSGMLRVDEARVREMHYLLMGQYKLLIFIFNLAPWVALWLMA